jgi:Domain of unknown function (DUF4383)
MTTATNRRAREIARPVAMVVAATFLLVGVLGFVPGIVTDYDQLSFAGHDSGAMLLGLFQVSILHNLVHVLFGVVGLVLARAGAGTAFLVGGGAVYLVLWLYGILVHHDSAANFVPINTADNWLHLVLGLAMIGLGLYARRARAA